MALQKVHPNKAPYGYIRNKETGHLEIDPIASEVVKDVYKLYTKNYGIRPIEKKMKEDNRYLKSGKWCDNRIYNILQNPIYNGTYHHGRKARRKEDVLVVENYCPKIIDDKLFNQVQNVLIKNKNSNYGSHIHLFTALVKCPSCGNIMSSTIAYKNKKNGTRKEYYFIECRNDNCKDKGKSYNTDKLENKLIAMLNELMIYSIVNDHIITIPNIDNEDEINKISKAIEKLKVQEKKLVELYVNSDLDVEVINSKNKMVKTELEEMKDQLEKNKVKLEQADNKSKELDNSSSEVHDIIGNLKQSKLNKSTYLLNEEDRTKLDKYVDEVRITNKNFQDINLLSVTIDNVKDQLEDDKKVIELYEENNLALSVRNKALNKKIEEQSKVINELEEENSKLRQTIRYFKDKFNKLMKLLKEKLFGWGKKDPLYEQVVNDLYDKDILDDDNIKEIKKGNYEL